jgi:hypothetical protein
MSVQILVNRLSFGLLPNFGLAALHLYMLQLHENQTCPIRVAVDCSSISVAPAEHIVRSSFGWPLLPFCPLESRTDKNVFSLRSLSLICDIRSVWLLHESLHISNIGVRHLGCYETQVVNR